MSAKGVEIGLEYGPSGYEAGRWEAGDTTPHRLQTLLRQLGSGVFYPGSWTSRDGVTNLARKVSFPLLISCYLVPQHDTTRGGESEAFVCSTYQANGPADLARVVPWGQRTGQRAAFNFEAYHLIQPVPELSQDTLRVIDLLTMQFQREWGSKEKLLVERLRTIAGVSHDLCHQIYDVLGVLRAWEGGAGTPPEEMVGAVEGLLVSMFGVPWRQRAFRDGTDVGSLLWATGSAKARDARLWDYISGLKLQASSGPVPLRCADQSTHCTRSTPVLWAVRTEELTLPTSQLAAELRLLKRLRDPRIRPWPLSKDEESSMR